MTTATPLPFVKNYFAPEGTFFSLRVSPTSVPKIRETISIAVPLSTCKAKRD